MPCHGSAGLGVDWLGTAGPARWVRLGTAGAWQARKGKARRGWHGPERLDATRQAGSGEHGLWRGRRGKGRTVWLGAAGGARHGGAGTGPKKGWERQVRHG